MMQHPWPGNKNQSRRCKKIIKKYQDSKPENALFYIFLHLLLSDFSILSLLLIS